MSWRMNRPQPGFGRTIEGWFDRNVGWVGPLGMLVLLVAILGGLVYSTDGGCFNASRGYVKSQNDLVLKELAEIKELLKKQ